MQYRRRIIVTSTFLGGIYFFLEYVLPWNRLGVPIERYHSAISNGFITVGAMAIGLGIINILLVHGAKVLFKRKGFVNSLALLTGLVLMMTVTLVDWRFSQRISEKAGRLTMLRDFAAVIQQDHEAQKPGVPPLGTRFESLAAAVDAELAEVERDLRELRELRPPADDSRAPKIEKYGAALEEGLAKGRGELERLRGAFSGEEPDFALFGGFAAALAELGSERAVVLNLMYEFSTVRGSYNLLYRGLFEALGAAMFSMLGFYIAAAAYRAFRIRSPESSLMMLAALLVMLGQIPFGRWIEPLLPGSWELAEVRLFLLQVPNAAAFRAIQIGASVGFVIMAFRMWLSIESESFGERTE